MALTLTKFYCFSEDLVEGLHDWGSDSFKFYLTNNTPDLANDTEPADLAEITAEHGYSSGGHATTCSYSRAGGVTSIVFSDVTITASGGTFGPLRYAVLYNVTQDRLIGYYDLGVSITPDSATDDAVIIDNNAAGVLQVT